MMNAYAVLLTGAGGGIGQAIATSLLDNGFNLALGYHKGKKACQDIHHQFPDQTCLAPLDLGELQDASDYIGDIEVQIKKPILALINNAGMAEAKDFLDITVQDWHHMMQVNMISNALLAKAIIPTMRTHQFGRIIQISSISGQNGGVYQPHYAASKAAQMNLTKSLTRLYAKDGICANNIAIGQVATQMMQEEMEKPEFATRLAAIPAGRLGKVEEIASIVRFLLGDEAAYINGQTIHINGGAYCGG